jgi:hypothetical protein
MTRLLLATVLAIAASAANAQSRYFFDSRGRVVGSMTPTTPISLGRAR